MIATQTHSLTDRAMLISLNIRQWSAQKNDKRVDKEVSDNHNSDITMGRYNKSLVAKDALEKLKKIAGAARTEHYFRTLPWRDDGYRILSSAGYFDYSAKIADFKAEFDSALNHFLQAYPRYVVDAQGKLNGLYNAADYPSASQIARKFEFTTLIQPLPDASDFRVSLGDDETRRIREEMQEQTQAVIDSAMRDVWKRCYDVTQKMSERLKSFSRTENGTQGAFRDSLVTNITELLDILPSLNITRDKELDRIAADMRRNLTSYDAEELREQDTARMRVAEDAERIMKAMEDYI